MKPKYNKRAFAISGLRRQHYRWAPKWEAEKRSKVERGLYFCENPDCGQIMKKKDTQMDHIIPVVNPDTGFTTLDEYAERLFVEVDGYQRLCCECHNTKSAGENKIRKETSKKKKAAKEKA